ncbi:MAG TPA: hypothetical protein VNA87_05905 [Actinomycetota bacterium]|nr:hypothetical protein [Actinomycetota bacterium]
MSNIENFRSSGSPSPEQERIIIAALEKLLLDEKRQQSKWKTASRAQALGVGAADLRSGTVDAWGASKTVGWQGQGPQDLRGRGDAK